MIIDLKKFIREEKPFWNELETMLDRLENQPDYHMDMDAVKRFHYLYQRASADLAKIMTFSSEKEIRGFLESLVARTYSEIYEIRDRKERFSPVKWFFATFPVTFRKHIAAFWIAVFVFSAGALFGGAAIYADPEAKRTLIPYSHLSGSPGDRVAQEEKDKGQGLENGKAQFSSFLIVNNTKVSIYALALGMTWGIGTILILFLNGALLGAVCADYIMSGQAAFLAGWLLPHGAVEIPSILLAGQSGLILAKAIVGWEDESLTIGNRLRKISGDLTTIIFGVAILLIWAGLVEAFFSQYHEPVISYGTKIGFGIIEILLISLFLIKSGEQDAFQKEQHPHDQYA